MMTTTTKVTSGVAARGVSAAGPVDSARRSAFPPQAALAAQCQRERSSAAAKAGLSLQQRQQRRFASVVVQSQGPAGVDDLGKFDDDGNEIIEEKGDEIEMDWKGKFFGIYLQLAVWVTVLSFAGYSGVKGVLEKTVAAEDVGLLMAPTGSAIFLIATFLVYTSLNAKKKE